MRVVDRLLAFQYVSKADREAPEEEQTVFTLRGLPYDLQQKLESRVQPKLSLPSTAVGEGEAAFKEAMRDQGKVEVEISGGRTELQFDILSYGLVKIENLIGPDGTEVPYPGTNAPERQKKNFFAQWLPPELRTELANEIVERSTLTEDDVKN